MSRSVDESRDDSSESLSDEENEIQNQPFTIEDKLESELIPQTKSVTNIEEVMDILPSNSQIYSEKTIHSYKDLPTVQSHEDQYDDTNSNINRPKTSKVYINFARAKEKTKTDKV